MTNLEHHYKERDPLDTVQKISNYLTEHGFEIKLDDLNESEAGTWYCHLDLFKDGIFVAKSNGKGMTKEYALASGYAELYERFCNQINYLGSAIWAHDFIEANKKENGYYFSPDEKLMSNEELLNSSKRVADYFNYVSDGNEELKKVSMDFITEGQGIGVPMKNIDNSDVMYMDPRLLLRVSRSNGMAAGNTLDEALVQALSEIVEREVTEKVFFGLATETFYAINLDKIEDPKLRISIDKIKNEGYDFYLFDMSYVYNMPVIMSLLINKKNGNLNLNFGSFPVFEIAAERVLTELYQGIKSYQHKAFKLSLQLPYKNFEIEDVLSLYGNSITGEFFSADFFKHIKYVDTYNKDCFVNKDSSNEQLLQYFIDFSHKTPGIKFYYFDNSLLPDLYAVYVLLENTDEYCPMSICTHRQIKYNEISILQTIKTIKSLEKIESAIHNNEIIDMKEFYSLLNILVNSEGPTTACLDYLALWNNFFIVSGPRSFEFFDSILDIEKDFIPETIINTEYLAAYKKYLQLRMYVKTGKYTNQELLDIFNNIFNYKITEEDIYNCCYVPYLLQKIYIDSIRNYINSQGYKDLIDIYVKK